MKLNSTLIKIKKEWRKRKFGVECLWDFPGGPVIKNPPADAGDRGWSLVGDNSACCGATDSAYHSYWSWGPGACAPQREKPLWWETHAGQLEKALAQQLRPRAAKNK